MPLWIHRLWSILLACVVCLLVNGGLAGRSDVRPALAQTCAQAAENPDFEEGSRGWEIASATNSAIIVSDAAFHGQYGAHLGGVDLVDDRLWQWVTFPGNVSDVSLTFFYRMETSDTYLPPADQLTVEILDDREQTLVHIGALNNQSVRGQWFRRVYFFDPQQIARIAGKTVRFQFHATTDHRAPTHFFIDDIDLQVCTGGAPSVSGLRMGPSSDRLVHDHFPTPVDQVLIAFDYANMNAGDTVRLQVRDEFGTTLLDTSYSDLIASGTKQLVFTALDAVDGLTRSGLSAGDSAIQHAAIALQATTRFAMIPYAERAVFDTNVLRNVVWTMDRFNVGREAEAYLAEARTHVDLAAQAGQAVLDPTISLPASRQWIATLQSEAQIAMIRLAQARDAVVPAGLAFPETTDCRFYLTNVYLYRAPVDSLEWTVGNGGPPARIHPPQDMRRAGAMYAQPPTIYTQAVPVAGVPHKTTISGRVTDADCRPVADGTPVRLTVDDPDLGTIEPALVTTTDGYFTTTLHATEALGIGAVNVRAAVEGITGGTTVFLVGPPASVTINLGSQTIAAGDTTPVVVQVRDARGKVVADGTEVVFRVSPTRAGTIFPDQTTTSTGLATASFQAGETGGFAAVQVAVGSIEGSAVLEIEGPAADPPADPAPTPTPGPARVCDTTDSDQLCHGRLTVRVFEDPRCDGQFNPGIDRPVFGVSVSFVYPDGTSLHKTTDPNGYAPFDEIVLQGDERGAVVVEYPPELVVSGLTPCANSGTLRHVSRRDFGSLGTASMAFRAHRQIVSRRGILRLAEASLCFTATYFLEPTDGGPVVYLATDQDLSEYLDGEVWVTGSTWELQFCRYLLPVSIGPVP